LRERVLPLVREYLSENRKPQLIPADTELYVVETRIAEKAQVRPANRWKRTKPRMMASLATLRGEMQQASFVVIVKTEELFRDKSVCHKKSLGWLMRTAEAALGEGEVAATALLEEVRLLHEAALPRDVLEHAALKNRICTIVDFRADRSRAVFKPEFKTWLRNRDPDLVTALPDHLARAPSRAPPEYAPLGVDLSTRFSPVLDEAVGRDAFRLRGFVTAA